jgi:choline dehydrogenase-like flavoprotein
MNEVIHTDVAIIGSGIAGALVAHRLAAKGIKVVILEAGPRIDRAKALETFTNSPLKTDQTPYPQNLHALHPGSGQEAHQYVINRGSYAYDPHFIRGVGGTTWHWAGETWRFLPVDFKLKTHYRVGRDWPLSYNDLEPYYCLAEKEIGVAGDTDVGSPRSQPYPMPPVQETYWDKTLKKLIKPLGYEVVIQPAARNTTAYDGRPPCCGSHNCIPICPVGAQYSGDVHVKKAENAGAQLLANAVVDFLKVGPNRTIEELTFQNPEGKKYTVRAKKFVLAANGIETPKLLLLSRSERSPHGAANSSDQVGRNLMDHPGYKVEFSMPEPVYIGRGPVEVCSVMNLRDGSFRKEYGSIKIGVWNSVPPLEDVMSQVLKREVAGKELKEVLRSYISRRATLTSFHEQLPEPENRVSLSSLKDPLGIPRPEIHYGIGEYSLKSIEHTRGVFDKILKHLKAEDVVYGPKITTNNHIMGTTIMGENSKNSVVDVQCRTHDHKNLFIAGSSVFASGAAVNCTLTIAALSLRLADQIVKDGFT